MSAKGKFGVFSLASLETPWSTSAGVDDTGKVVRQRHYHRKSRNGCTRCKARKVKCDEKRPTCGKCSMRGEECVFESVDDVLGEVTMHRASHGGQKLSSKQRFATPGIRSIGRSAEIPHIGAATEELMPLRLMHHFEHFTSGTLLFGKHFWRDRILPLALHHDFLMHAVLTLSASHLSYFLPHLSGTKRAMNIHLSHTLPGFRNGVSRITSSQDSDAIIACGILLLYYACSDGLLWFATGLQEVITTAYEAQRHGTVPGGIFANIAIPQYMQILSDIRTRTGSTGRSYNFAEKFLGLQQLPSIEVQRACRETKLESRLDPIFYAVDSLTVGLDMTEILPSFRTYSLTWPSKAPKEFINQVERAEPHALLILLSFYACVGLMLSEDAWWARRRCKVMCEAILSQLTCSSWSENVTHIARYFRFNQNENGSWEIGSSWVGMMRNLEDEE